MNRPLLAVLAILVLLVGAWMAFGISSQPSASVTGAATEAPAAARPSSGTPDEPEDTEEPSQEAMDGPGDPTGKMGARPEIPEITEEQALSQKEGALESYRMVIDVLEQELADARAAGDDATVERLTVRLERMRETEAEREEELAEAAP
ncbi:MAG: hypothetical protein EP330_04215 [Deltaproteobacteria bacterium]|nr:MAG: hypothetical protein EP330_04215 [Deltaproteobacteria bacterium]